MSWGKTRGRSTRDSKSFLSYTAAEKPSLGTGQKGGNYSQRLEKINGWVKPTPLSLSLRTMDLGLKLTKISQRVEDVGCISVAGTELHQRPRRSGSYRYLRVEPRYL